MLGSLDDIERDIDFECVAGDGIRGHRGLDGLAVADEQIDLSAKLLDDGLV